ncbi:hypothetical protein DQ384_31320 [Sphaerisporangium album]|uniref:Uncharacterized protein n=1 Tax=Sphaerisporangium album TaxID=509200 RepID=A0A367F730_9ACTN|nr:hypothetical protein [Sphaerisporangium album]RCG25360.1 hypothetical protein DQ384_31320 [Sphaerisporangium album]
MAGVLPYLTACRARLFRTRAPAPCAPKPATRPAPEPPGWCGYAPGTPAATDAPSPASPSPQATEGTEETEEDATAAEVEALRTAHPGWRVWCSGRTWYACGPWLEARLVHAPTPERLSSLITLRTEGGR